MEGGLGLITHLAFQLF